MMSKPILCAVAILAMNGSVSLGQGAAPLTVIRAGTLIDGVSEAPRKNQLIFVRGERLEKVADGSAAIPAGTKVIDLSNATVLPGLIDAHTHIFLWGEDPAKGGYDANILKAGIALRAARATYAARRALEQGFTTLRDLETEGAGYGDIEIKQAIEEGTIPGPRIFGATRAISTTGGYNLEGYAPELEMPRGAQLVGGQARKPGFAADADSGRVEGHRGRNARMAEESGVPRVQRNRSAAGAGRRMRFDRARIGDHRRADRADAAAGDVVLPDYFALLRGLGAGGHRRRKARPRAGGSPRNHVQEGAASAFENCLWDGYGRNSVDGTHCAGV